MKAVKFFIIFFAFGIIIYPQKKDFTIEDVVFNSYYKLAPKNLNQLKWIPESNNLSHLITDTTGSNLVKMDVNNKNSSTLISLTEINKQLTNAAMGKGLKRFPQYKWTSKNTFTFWKDSNLISVDVKTKKLKYLNSITGNAENKFIAPNNKYVAFTNDNNLSVAICKNSIAQITNEKNKGIVSGTSVHRNEFGITKGIFWSPKSNYIAFYQKDETMVTDYPIVEIGTIPAKLKNIKYPMAGQKSHHVKVGIYSLEKASTIWLETGKPLEQYLTNLTWGPNEKYFYIAHLNRDQNHMQLIKYDIATGKKIKVLFEEKSEKYVEPENPLYFLPKNENKFLWFSERDGWQHLYLYNTEGTLIKQVTKGNWKVLSILGFDKNGKNVFISATKESPIERHAYKVNISSGKITKLTHQKGIHSLIANKDGNYFIDSYTSTTIPRNIDIIDIKGNKISSLLISENPIKDYKVSSQNIFTIKNDEGTELYCRLIKPVDFDKNKKYPVIVYVYGGPHAQLVTNHWPRGRYDFWFQYMAEHGYVVFTLDNRGSFNRGLNFEQATFRNLGTTEIEDQLKGIEYLSTLSYVDTSRIGVFGWSFGGFMTTSLMLRTNNKFKVGVGGGAVIDWKMYEVMYTERYMDTPQTNPEGYKKANLLNYVNNLNGKLLLVHGTSDPTVVWQHTLSFVKKATELNKPLDYFPYVGQPHGVRGKDAIHLYNKISNYFFNNL
jgi:dipeptidyl-peptidase-4